MLELDGDAPDGALEERLRRSLYKPVADLQLKRRRRTVKRLLRPFKHAVNSLADTALGLDTAKKEAELAHFHPDRGIYQASGWTYLRRGLRRRDVTPSDVFVDFGSGKGRVLCQAARRYPFARVIGVEISETLSDIARSNLERNLSKFLCKQVELVTADVLDFEIHDDITVAYFFHPFAGKTFETIIDRLVESIERRPRRFTIVYACPGLGSYILATGRFRLSRTSRGGWRDFLYRRVSVYVHESPAAADVVRARDPHRM